MTQIFSLLIALFSFTSIYDYSISDIDGNTISLSQFQGKKMLLVNTASNSQYTSQYQGLEQLYQRYSDSLVIIAIPSNSFGHEPLSNAAIKQFVSSNYNNHFILGAKTDVAGTNQCPLYNWLTHSAQNGVMENTLSNDFYKFLIDRSGNLIGAFAPSVDPMSQQIQDAIENDN